MAAWWARTPTFTGPIILVVLTTLAGYTFSRIRTLSLPLPQTIAILTVLLPVLSALSTLYTHHLITPTPRLTLRLLALLLVSTAYKTILVIFSLLHLVPSTLSTCALDTRWNALYRARDAASIRRIQDTFQCCGYRNPLDQAWPFPGGERHGEKGKPWDECREQFGYERACGPVWAGEERLDAGLVLAVAVVTFLIEVFSLIAMLRPASRATSWLPGLRAIAGSGAADHAQRRVARRLMFEGDCETGNEHYRDEAEEEDGEETGQIEGHGNGNGHRVVPDDEDSNRPRVEASPLLDDWRGASRD